MTNSLPQPTYQYKPKLTSLASHSYILGLHILKKHQDGKSYNTMSIANVLNKTNIYTLAWY